MQQLVEYLVLTQKDRAFSGKFDPGKLEAVLNAYADEGWHIVSTVSASIPGFVTGNREELVVIFERLRYDR